MNFNQNASTLGIKYDGHFSNARGLIASSTGGGQGIRHGKGSTIYRDRASFHLPAHFWPALDEIIQITQRYVQALGTAQRLLLPPEPGSSWARAGLEPGPSWAQAGSEPGSSRVRFGPGVLMGCPPAGSTPRIRENTVGCLIDSLRHGGVLLDRPCLRPPPDW